MSSREVMDRLSKGSAFFYRNLEAGTELEGPLATTGTHGSKIWFCDFPKGIVLKSLIAEIAFSDAPLEDELELVEIVLYTGKILPTAFPSTINPANNLYFRDWTSEDFRYAGVPNGFASLRFGNGWKDFNELDVLVEKNNWLLIQVGAVVKAAASISSLRIPTFIMYDVLR